MAELGSVRDADLGDVMTLGKMYKTGDAVAFLRERFQIPDVTVSSLTKARRRGEITATVFGQSVVYAERDLIGWIASRYGNSERHRALQSEAIRAAKRDAE